MRLRCRLCWALVGALAGPGPGAAPPSPDVRLLRPKMSFAQAARPYQGLRYDLGGYVGADGKVRRGGLGCSAYTSAVLHRMRDGEGWLARYNLSVHQWYGERAAEHFGLVKAGRFASADLLDARRTRALIAEGKLRPGALYYFNARRGKNGHVGFVRVGAAGELEQSHYSSIVGKLYTGDYRGWLRASLYRTAAVELYAVPEPARKAGQAKP